MQAIEFETTVQNHVIRIPDSIPEGAVIRVLVLVDDKLIIQPKTGDVKNLLATVTEGLSDSDIARISTKSQTREKPFFEQLRLENECADDDLALLFERDKDTGRDCVL